MHFEREKSLVVLAFSASRDDGALLMVIHPHIASLDASIVHAQWQRAHCFFRIPYGCVSLCSCQPGWRNCDDEQTWLETVHSPRKLRKHAFLEIIIAAYRQQLHLSRSRLRLTLRWNPFLSLVLQGVDLGRNIISVRRVKERRVGRGTKILLLLRVDVSDPR